MFIFHFKTISGFIRSLWGSMGFYGVSMGFYGVLWGSMGFYGVKRRTGLSQPVIRHSTSLQDNTHPCTYF